MWSLELNCPARTLTLSSGRIWLRLACCVCRRSIEFQRKPGSCQKLLLAGALVAEGSMVEELRARTRTATFLSKSSTRGGLPSRWRKYKKGGGACKLSSRRRCRNGQGSDMFGSCMGGMWACGVPCGGERRRTIVVSFGCRTEEPNLHDQHVCGTARRESAIDFGQFRLRPAFFFFFSTSANSTSANFDFGQFRLRPISTSANFWMLNFGTTKSGAPKGGAPKGGAPKGGAPKGGGPKISRFFFPLPPQLSFFSPSLWWCLKRRGPEMCTFGVLGLSCEARGPAEGCPAEGCPAEGCPAEGVEHPFNMWSRKSSTLTPQIKLNKFAEVDTIFRQKPNILEFRMNGVTSQVKSPFLGCALTRLARK